MTVISTVEFGRVYKVRLTTVNHFIILHNLRMFKPKSLFAPKAPAKS